MRLGGSVCAAFRVDFEVVGVDERLTNFDHCIGYTRKSCRWIIFFVPR